MARQLRDAVWRRAEDRCEYCRIPQECDPLPFEIDHVIAQKHHGQTSLDNLALACFPCNNHKGPNLAGIDPQSGDVVALFHPRKDHWAEHFAWQRGWVLGKTPSGRATVDVLCMNLLHRVAHRESLIDEEVREF